MSFFRTVLSWASSAWSALFGAATNPIGALQSLWHFITSVHSLVSWLFGNPLLTWLANAIGLVSGLHDLEIAIRDAFHRLAAWIWATWIRPAIVALTAQIAALRQWTFVQLLILTFTVYRLYNASLAFTRQQVGIERQQRIAAIAAEHAAMLEGDKATLATVQRQASTGYNATRHDRLSVIGQLADDLASREPALQSLLPRLIGYVIDLESIDNPVIRFLAGKLLSEVLAKTGADHLIGDLIGSLIGDLTGGGPPRDLAGVEKDVGNRLNAVEAWQASFEHHGGPEVEDAGDQWKELTGVIADIAILGFFGQALADPQRWAQEVAVAVGDPANTALIAVINTLRRF